MNYNKNSYADWLVKLMDFLRFRFLRVIAFMLLVIPILVFNIFGLIYDRIIKSGDLQYLFTQTIETFEDVWNWK